MTAEELTVKYQHVILTRLGGPEVLEVVESEMARPEAGQVRVKVEATGVAFADVMMRHGKYPGVPKPPFTPGYDIVGVVEEVGPEVSGFSPGQRVVALTKIGGYAQQILLPADELVAVPAAVDPVLAESLPLNYVSAYQMLHRVARVQPGERVLIHGAAGGVGSALLQLGRLAGLELYGTASRAKHGLLERYGATAIDYRSEDFVSAIPGGVDVVLDPIGGRHLWRSFKALRRGGRAVVYGFSAALNGSPLTTPFTFISATLMNLAPGKAARFYSITSLKKQHPDWYREDLTTLLNLLAAGKIAPVVAERLPLAQAARAHDLLERSAVSGKIVLLPNG
jgi:NADPH:quinone reductase-like Zn-dependent oxidoreductase